MIELMYMKLIIEGKKETKKKFKIIKEMYVMAVSPFQMAFPLQKYSVQFKLNYEKVKKR